jgi:hypothetical protein
MWGLLALRLSDEEILPFNYSSYVAELEVTCPSDILIHSEMLAREREKKKFSRALL